MIALFNKSRPQARRRHTPQPVVPRAININWRWTAGVLLSVGVLGATVAGVRWLLLPQTLPIKRVLIGGQFQHLTAGQLQAAIANTVSGGFFTVKVGAVMQAAHTLPWVDTVSVRRIWPDTLRLDVVEQVPLARWGEHALVNRRGERFTPPADSLPTNLPSLQGPSGLEAALTRNYYDMGKALAPAGLKITRLIQDERRSWRVTLDNGIELRLGRDDAYPRLLRFVRLYPKVLAARASQIASIDLRYTNGFAVAWNHPPEGAMPTHPEGHT